MYRNKLDRLRLFTLLVRLFRDHLEKRGTSRKAIVDAAGGRPAHIGEPELTHLCKLDSETDSGRRHIGRSAIIRLLNKGLGFRQHEVDALLWLYEGKPFCEEDRERSPLELNPAITLMPQHYQDEELNKHLVDLMGRIVDLESEPYHARAQILFQHSDEALLKSSEKLLAMEREPGVILLILTSLTPLLYDPTTDHAARRQPMIRLMAEPYRSLRRDNQIRRNKAAVEHLDTYGMRCIHSKRALLEYFAGRDTGHDFTMEERRGHLDRWIRLMSDSPLHIGIVDQIPRMEVETKSTKHVVVRGALYKEDATTYSWGVRFIFFNDELSVLSFMWDFEREWLRIPKHMRGPDAIERFKELRDHLNRAEDVVDW